MRKTEERLLRDDHRRRMKIFNSLIVGVLAYGTEETELERIGKQGLDEKISRKRALEYERRIEENVAKSLPKKKETSFLKKEEERR